MRTINIKKNRTSPITIKIADERLEQVTNAAEHLSEILGCDVSRNMILVELIEDAVKNAVFSVEGNEYSLEELSKLEPSELKEAAFGIVEAEELSNDELLPAGDSNQVEYNIADNQMFIEVVNEFMEKENEKIKQCLESNLPVDWDSFWHQFLNQNTTYESIDDKELKNEIYNYDVQSYIKIELMNKEEI